MRNRDPRRATALAQGELAANFRVVADLLRTANAPDVGTCPSTVAAALKEGADFVERLSENDPCIMAIAASWELPHGFHAYTVMSRPIILSHGLHGESPQSLLVSLGEIAVSLLLPPKSEAA